MRKSLFYLPPPRWVVYTTAQIRTFHSNHLQWIVVKKVASCVTVLGITCCYNISTKVHCRELNVEAKEQKGKVYVTLLPFQELHQTGKQ